MVHKQQPSGVRFHLMGLEWKRGRLFQHTIYPAVTAVKTGSVLRPASFVNAGSASTKQLRRVTTVNFP